MKTDNWICAVLDGASAELLAHEELGQFPTGGTTPPDPPGTKTQFPAELRVSSRVYECFTGLRARELADGLPLLVLGTEVTEDRGLASAEFVVRS